MTFYPYYANCSFAIVYCMGFTMIGMIVKNLVHYCRFGVLRQSNFYDDYGNARLGSFFACIIASQLFFIALISLFYSFNKAVSNNLSLSMTSSQLNLFALFFVTVNYCGLGGNVSLPQVFGSFLVLVGTVCSYLTIAYN